MGDSAPEALVPSPLVIQQFGRLVGQRDLLAQLGLPADGPLPDALTDAQRERARALARERAPHIGEALLAEAMALDDIQDAAGAITYLEERLAFFGAVIPDDARAAIRDAFRAVAGRWG